MESVLSFCFDIFGTQYWLMNFILEGLNHERKKLHGTSVQSIKSMWLYRSNQAMVSPSFLPISFLPLVSNFRFLTGSYLCDSILPSAPRSILTSSPFNSWICNFLWYMWSCWSLTFREESRLRVFENRILRWMFGPKRDENGEWRRLHNEELHSLYRSPNIIRVMKSRRLRWAGHVARMEEGRSAFKILTGKPFREA